MKNELDQLPPDQRESLAVAMQEIREPQSVEEVYGMLDCTEKGKAKQTRDNCITVFRLDPLLRGAFKKNELSGRIDVVKPLGWKRETEILSDSDLNRIYAYVELNYGQHNDKYMKAALQIVAEDNAYHPIRDILNSLEWDGEPRIRFALHHFLGADVDDYTEESLKLFMLGAIHRVFKRGCKFENMLCLVGGQGAGKSTFFQLLAINDEWFSDDLKRLDDENVARKMQGHWIIEMSEMIATANAKSIEEIKSFLSRRKETYKVPYATEPEDRLRQCVFGGTSNTMDFLPLDRSGNRRFIPILCKAEEAEVHILEDEEASRKYILQMWAEAMQIYRKGNWKLTFSNEMQKYLAEHQRDFMPEDTDAGMIAAFLENHKRDRICSQMLYDEALGKDHTKAKRFELRDICDIMRNCFPEWVWVDSNRNVPGYGKQKYWYLPQEDDGFVSLDEHLDLDLPFK